MNVQVNIITKGIIMARIYKRHGSSLKAKVALEALKEKEETRLHQLQTQTNTLNVNNVASGLKLTKNEIIFWQILGTCPGIRRLTRTRTTSKF